MAHNMYEQTLYHCGDCECSWADEGYAWDCCTKKQTQPHWKYCNKSKEELNNELP